MTDFWARRKQAVVEETQSDARFVEEAEAAKTEAAFAERSDEEVLAELDLPQPEDLDSSDAVREFLSSAVPQRLKTRALRRLWTLNPVLANLDGLIDYGEDFTDSATVVENLQTAYQVGKGMLAHVEELAKAQAEKDEQTVGDDEDQPDEEGAAASEVAVLEPAPDDAEEDAQEPVEPPVVALSYPEEDAVPLPSAPRRMQFRFEEPA